ncbi:MAG TPA: hypothetical protein VER55_14470 [Ardenticatenaceae bacterium]|nr:hypothetical protein [Ardenticatenaceae bacterium]
MDWTFILALLIFAAGGVFGLIVGVLVGQEARATAYDEGYRHGLDARPRGTGLRRSWR